MFVANVLPARVLSTCFGHAKSAQPLRGLRCGFGLPVAPARRGNDNAHASKVEDAWACCPVETAPVVEGWELSTCSACRLMRKRFPPCWKPRQRSRQKPLDPFFEISFRRNDGHDLRSLDDDLARFLAAQTIGDGFQRHLLKFLIAVLI